MTTDRTQPPSDELMGKVVAKWKGWRHGSKYHPDGPRGSFFTNIVGPEHIAHPLVVDPRTDTNAALDLLGYLMGYHKACDEPIISFDTEWQIHDFACCDGVLGHPVREIPTSGEPFCIAVCWLAVDVLGVEDV